MDLASSTCSSPSHNSRQIVRFRSLERPKEDDFCLELSKIHTYDDVVERVARKIGLEDPSKIRLTSNNSYSQQPKPYPLKYQGVENLSEMLIHFNKISDILYYEILDIPLHELECLKNLKVVFHHATKDEVVTHNIRLPKQSTVGDVIDELKKKVELSHPNAELRLLEVINHKICKIFPPSEKIESINDQYWTLRAEEIPEEEKNLGPNDQFIHVLHFTKGTAQNPMQENFGEPFCLVIHEGETLAEVKVRIQKKLQVPDEDFSKWKFALLALGRTEYLKESDMLFNRFQSIDLFGVWMKYLGLEHGNQVPVPVQEPWIPPPTSVVKINSDASYDKQARMYGIGFLVRDEEGKILDVSTDLVSAESIETAAIMAIREGCIRAKDRGCNKVIFESNNFNIIERLNNADKSGSWTTSPIEQDIHVICQNFQQSSFSFVRRNCNKAASWVARHARLNSNDCNWVINPPQDLVPLL